MRLRWLRCNGSARLKSVRIAGHDHWRVAEPAWPPDRRRTPCYPCRARPPAWQSTGCILRFSLTGSDVRPSALTLSQHAARREIGHQRTDAEGPRLAGRRGLHAIGQRAELGRGDGDKIAVVMGEAAALGVAVLGRREHRAEEQREAIGILMGRADGLAHQILW